LTALAICVAVCLLSTVAAQRTDDSAGRASAATSASGELRSASSDSTAHVDPHVRILDARVRALVESATGLSPTLRQLIERLEHSDVVAYVRCDMETSSTASGHLAFVGATAGLRYVMIQVRHLGSKQAQAALIGHELRHAVEVADAPKVIDVASFDAEYARIGFTSTRYAEHTLRSYETMDAVRAGEQIRNELRQSTE
jgi:hypothetical protein